MRERIEVEGLTVEFNRPHPTIFMAIMRKYQSMHIATVSLQGFIHKASKGEVEDFTNLAERIEQAYTEAERTLKKYHDMTYEHFRMLEATLNGDAWNRENYDRVFQVDDEKTANLLQKVIQKYSELSLTEAEVKN